MPRDSRLDQRLLLAWSNCVIKVKHFNVLRADTVRRQHRVRDHYVLLLSFDHECRIRRGGTELLIGAGMAGLLPPGSGFTHEIPHVSGWTGRLDFYLVRGVGMIDPLTLLPLPAVCRMGDPARCRAHAEAIRDACPGPRLRLSRSILRVRPLADALLGSVLDDLLQVTEPSDRAEIPGWLGELWQWLRTHYMHVDMSLDTCVRRCGYSESHISHAFRKAYGIAPMAFVREQRMALACRLLDEQREETVRTIARRCGYRSAAHFTREFHNRFGSAPSRWRKRT